MDNNIYSDRLLTFQKCRKSYFPKYLVQKWWNGYKTLWVHVVLHVHCVKIQSISKYPSAEEKRRKVTKCYSPSIISGYNCFYISFLFLCNTLNILVFENVLGKSRNNITKEDIGWFVTEGQMLNFLA